MDFSLNETQEAIRDLARKIFSAHVRHERLLELERSGEWFDRELWQAVAAGGLSGVAIPERCGGSGLGIFELCLVLEEQGRAVAPVPLLATALLGALPIAQFGTPAQQDRWLRPVIDSAGVLSAALVELGSFDPAAPRVTAQRDGADWRLDGVKECVPAATQAAAILVPASAGRDAGPAIAAAKWWAAVAGSRVTHTAQHLHGGIGSDIEYPVHRYFLWSKQNELLLGGPAQQAANLGKWLAAGHHA
jgi:alkylation response protein AidB-like acyl-CoA dehydrogenase